MRPVQAVDLSNYDPVPTADQVACMKASGIGLAIVRGSLEDTGKTAIARAQLQAFIDGGIETAIYVWCYGDWDAAATAALAIKCFGDLITTKAVFLDVEDVALFTKHWIALSPGVAISAPHRFDAVRLNAPSLLAISGESAVEWLDTALNAFERAGYLGGIYSAEWCWPEITGDSTVFMGDPWWDADYDGNPDLSVFIPVGGVKQLAGKQYAGNAGAPLCGIVVDRSTFDMDALALPAPSLPEPAPGGYATEQELQHDMDYVGWRFAGMAAEVGPALVTAGQALSKYADLQSEPDVAVEHPEPVHALPSSVRIIAWESSLHPLAVRLFTGVGVPPAVTGFFRGLFAAMISAAGTVGLQYVTGGHITGDQSVVLVAAGTWMIREVESVLLDELAKMGSGAIPVGSGPPAPPAVAA